MDIAWESLQKRYDELAHLLSDPNLETGKRTSLQKEFSGLTPLLDQHKNITSLEGRVAQAKKDAEQTPDPDFPTVSGRG